MHNTGMSRTVDMNMKAPCVDMSGQPEERIETLILHCGFKLDV